MEIESIDDHTYLSEGYKNDRSDNGNQNWVHFDIESSQFVILLGPRE